MSYLSADQTAYMTGTFHSGHWETFSNFSTLVVERKPKEVISNVNASSYYGYGRTASNKNNVTYIPQSGSFPCIVRHKTDKQENHYIPDAQIQIIDGDVRIKILPDAKDYIEAESYERVKIDDQSFNIKSEPFTQNFLGLRYYYYDLERVK